MRKIRISELPVVSTLRGLFTIGTDANNNSVKVSLEFVENAADSATQAAASANAATTAANNATTAANGAAQAANTAAGNATSAASSANTAASAANTAAGTANTAASEADAAADEAERQAGIASSSASAADTAADSATQAAASALSAKGIVEAWMNSLIPTGIVNIEAPSVLTRGNVDAPRIKVTLAPTGVQPNIVFISDNVAVAVNPDGKLRPLRVGVSVIGVVPTLNTQAARIITIEVREPAMRFVNNSSSMRFTSAGNVRFL